MISIDDLKAKLSQYSIRHIIFTHHAREKALWRGIRVSEVIENIINPYRLEHVKEEPARFGHELKYDCYFSYGHEHCHRYVLALNGNCVVCTIVHINRNWRATL